MTFSIYKPVKQLERERREHGEVQKKREEERLEKIRAAYDPKASRKEFSEFQKREREEIAAKEAAKEAKRLAPLLKAQKEQEQLFRNLRSAYAWLLSEPDPEFVIDRDAPHTVYGTFEKTAQQVADEYSTEQFLRFQEETPEYYGCQENAAILTQYLTLNGNIHIVSAKTFKQAYNRLLEVGLMVTGASAPVEVENESPVEKPWCWIQDYNPASKPTVGAVRGTHWEPRGKPTDIVAGAHWETGEPCRITVEELNNLTTDQYRKFIAKDFREKQNALVAGTVLYQDAEGPVFEAYSYDFYSPYRKASDRLQGVNPETGQAWILTAREADALDARSFKKFCSGNDRSPVVLASDYGDKYAPQA